ncbi:MAG TPA: hypothetical protein QF564_06895 [Pirellulaceae bacterium]|nr:hypothetical protein [Pirellulaceae bacterium]
MSKPSAQKKERRRKKRQKREQHTKAYVSKKNAFTRFPEVVYDTEHAPEPLVRIVKQTMQDIVAEHERLLGPSMAGVFHQIREFGYQRVKELMRSFEALHGVEGPQDDTTWLEMDVIEGLGNLLVSRLPAAILKRYLPPHGIHVVPGKPQDSTLLIRILSLKQRKTEGGTAYYEESETRVNFGAQKGTPAFSRHAIERLCERTLYDPTGYGGIMQAFLMCSTHLLVRSYVNRDQWGMAIFCPCISDLAEFLAAKVLGEYDRGQEYLYRVGYCPVVFSDDLAVAKTLLVPGMEGTPEYEKTLRPHAHSHEEKRAIRQAIGELTFRNLIERQDCSWMRQFHEDGIPQVMTLTEFLRDFPPE